jgi:hypothetical protein
MGKMGMRGGGVDPLKNGIASPFPPFSEKLLKLDLIALK